MQKSRTRYPSYNVLGEKEHWDDHTRDIVLKRLGPFPRHRFLKDHESGMVRAVSKHIVYDNRDEILDYVVHHLDSTLASPAGEGQRKVGVPEQQVLIRRGLAAMDELSRRQHGKPFLKIDDQQQFEILAGIQLGRTAFPDNWKDIPPKHLFKKLASKIAEAYYSHPVVWSEIGYGGPAYPRGYVRVERGLTDPWEAKRDAHES